MEKFKKISFLLAALFIIVAFVIKFTRPEWQMYANYSVGAGILFFLISLYFERDELKAFFTGRAAKHGLNTIVLSLFVLGIVVLVNWIVNKHPMKYDTTKNKQFSLSSLTITSLQNLKEPVKVTAFFVDQDEGLKTKMKELLDNYQVYSRQLQVQMVDPLKSPMLAQKFGVTTNGTTIIESGTQKATINATSEEEITNAIIKVTSGKKVTVYFLQGHGEPSFTDFENTGLSTIVDELKKSNYVIQELKDLAATKKIPDDCNTLIVEGPSAALLDHEIKAITDYLANGGRVVVLDDPQADPSLAKLLEPYHIVGGNDVVVDDHYYFPLADVSVPFIQPKAATPLTKEFNLQMFFPVTRSLVHNETAASQGKLTYTPFLDTTQFSWAETDKQQAQFDEGKDTKGPITVGIAVSQPVESKEKKSSEMRLVVFGDADFIKNGFVTLAPGNPRIFLNAVAWLTEQENLIHLPPHDSKSDVMILTSTQLNYLALLLILVIPGAVVATGIAVWRKRKKL